MRVAFINSVCGYGSTGRIVVDQYNSLIQNGHAAFVAYGRKEGGADINSWRIGSRLSTIISIAQTRFFDTHGLNNRRNTKKLLKQLDSFRPDVIHLHNIHGYYVNYRLLFKYISEKHIPVVWNFHDCWAMTGHCSHFEYVGCDKWLTQCSRCPQKGEYPASFLLDRSRKNYILKKAAFTSPEKMTLIAPSAWLASVAARSYLSKYPRVEIPTGINLEIFTPTKSDLKEKLGITDEYILLGAASTLSDRKGYYDFIWLAEHLPEGYKLVLVGLETHRLNSLPKSIIGLSRVGSASEMAELYSMADVFINPTKEDTFPTVNLEALACGTPVITYDSGGSKDSLTPACGVVVTRDDKEGLLNAVTAMRAHPLAAADCRAQAMNYDRQVQVKKYLDIYEKYINNF